MITAAVVSILFKLLKQPVVLGYIVAGVLVGPYLFGKTLVNPDNVKQWGDIGVLFVLFCIGLEFRLKNLISSGKVAAIGALTIIVGMMLLGYAVGKDADFDMVNSLFLAGMLCMSSTTIVMKAIDEAGLSKERFVKGATSILIVEDVVAVVLMVLLSSIAIRHRFEGAELASKVVDLAITLAAWFICGILIIHVSLVIIIGMIVFATLGCWWGGETLRDSMLTSFSFVQIGEFSFIIASLGTSLGVLQPVIYPIIVAASVLTTFLTPYIMKAAVPCYTLLYNHASKSLRAKIDQREQQVAAAEAEAAKPSGDKSTLATRARHAVRNTFITKYLVNLFIKNMSAHDENAN